MQHQYKGYWIETFEREPDRWRARMSRRDGKPIKPVGAGDQTFPSIETSADTLSENAALDLAQKAIDAGGMR